MNLVSIYVGKNYIYVSSLIIELQPSLKTTTHIIMNLILDTYCIQFFVAIKFNMFIKYVKKTQKF